jgi:hypothetical protein
VVSPAMLVKAKGKGYPAQNCQYCHVSKVPKKEAFTRGRAERAWQVIVSEKEKAKAKEIDLD